MKKFLLLIVLICLFGAESLSTHIVGGEFEIIHVEGNTYLFRQVQYFDDIYGNPGAQDNVIEASIFRSSDDTYIMNITMVPVEDVVIPYSNPSCTNDIIITKRLVYENTITLDPEMFDDPQGYYMVWERCCRNHNITNIVSPDITGQTFYIEFPPLIKNSERFINSTPSLFPPLRDYACIDQFYYADFKGFDKDGDSLVYSLITPLNSSETGSTPNPIPTPKPKPHENILWEEGYNDSIQVPGSQPLQISHDGLLTVVPSQEGLFVFSVKCEEYRNGEKLGEVRRDFQLFVVDCPPPGNKPKIQAKAPGSDEFKEDIDNVVINYGDDSCFEIIVNDGDPNELIFVKAVPVNFNDSLENNLSINQGAITNPEDTLKFEFCLPHCINMGSFDPAIVDLYVYDNRCPQPLIDTLRITAYVNQPPNSGPSFEQPSYPVDSVQLEINEMYTIPIVANDADNDNLNLQILPVDFDKEDYAIDFVLRDSTEGEIAYDLLWDTNCDINNFSEKSHFEFLLIIEDEDECRKINADTLYFSVDVELPMNNKPELLVNGFENDTAIDIKIEELKNLLFTASDQDETDLLTINAYGIDFDLSDYGVEFVEVSDYGNIEHNWGLKFECGTVNINTVSSLDILFVVEDFDPCKAPNADSVVVTFNLLPPDNQAPVIRINNSLDTDTLTYEVGQGILLEISVLDPDGDNVDLDLMDYDDLQNFYDLQFTASLSGSSALGEFDWPTTCDLLSDNFQPGIYTITFESGDDKCFVPMTGSKEVTLIIEDKFIDYDFLPPNVFTPNPDDNINQTFYIPNLPGDNCENTFEEIIIYNRWGQRVFSSKKRDFQWEGIDKSNGVYYYTLIYSNKTMKGIINLLK